MINSSRIVPVTRTDLLTIYGNVLKMAGTSVAAVSASNPGVFAPASFSGNVIADEPVKSFDFGSTTAGVVYFIPAFDYEGFLVSGSAVTTAGATVSADGATLYTATLSTGTVTIAKVGF